MREGDEAALVDGDGWTQRDGSSIEQLARGEDDEGKGHQGNGHLTLFILHCYLV